MNNQYPPGWTIEYASYKMDRNNAVTLRLAIAAPELLKYLTEATENQCLYCKMYIQDKCTEVKDECYVQKWRNAIALASEKGE